MTPDDLRPSHWAGSLRTRLLVFLSIALLPLGVIAVFQTLQVISETERLAERDAVSRTAQAAEEQQVLLQRAFGAAFALGEAAADLVDEPETCSAIMADFIANQADFVFAGFIGADGVMTCTHTGETIDYRERPVWRAFAADPVPQVNVSRRGEVSRQSVYIVLVPLFDADTGTLLGAQAISIPHALSETLFAGEEGGLDLALIDAEGEILAASTGMDDIAAFERRGVVPESLDIPAAGGLFRDGPQDRFARPTAIVPLVAGQIYVLGLWTPGETMAGVSPFNRTVPVFPLLMWLASLAVAYITVSNLILTPLSRLSRQMRRYRPERANAPFVHLPDAPTEIAEIAESYNALLDRVAAGTAALQESVAEKETLLREVHHRVKNNLQLISSILNMQMRGVSDPGARHILSRVQDRVMSLSSVHRALYTENRLQTVRADLLLEDVIGGIANLTATARNPVDLDVTLAPVRLDPDQAVPLSLLATEAVTNALKHGATDGAGKTRIEVTLREDADGMVLFDVRNSRSPAEAVPSGDDGGGAEGSALGARLIASFASQLGGEVEISETDEVHDLQLRFRKLPVD